MAILVKYTGTNIGKIYLSDTGKRLGLGGGQEGDYNGGQDQYIIWGETKVLQETSEVLMSMSDGILKYFSTITSSSVFSTGAPLTLETGTYTVLDEVPSQILATGSGGGTGTNYRYSDEYLSRLANDKYAPTGLSGATGTYVGNSDGI